MTLAIDHELTLAQQMEYGDQGARDRLVLECMPLVEWVAARFVGEVPMDELVAEGSVAVVEAVDAYDWRMARLTTLVVSRVWARLSRFVREWCRVGLVRCDAGIAVDPPERQTFRRQRLADALAELEQHEQHILRRAYVDGWDSNDIAAERGCRPRWARRLRQRAETKLRERMA